MTDTILTFGGIFSKPRVEYSRHIVTQVVVSSIAFTFRATKPVPRVVVVVVVVVGRL